MQLCFWLIDLCFFFVYSAGWGEKTSFGSWIISWTKGAYSTRRKSVLQSCNSQSQLSVCNYFIFATVCVFTCLHQILVTDPFWSVWAWPTILPHKMFSSGVLVLIFQYNACVSEWGNYLRRVETYETSIKEHSFWLGERRIVHGQRDAWIFASKTQLHPWHCTNVG